MDPSPAWITSSMVNTPGFGFQGLRIRGQGSEVMVWHGSEETTMCVHFLQREPSH